MKSLILLLLTVLMPVFLYADPCPEDITPPLIESKGSIWDCSFDIFEDSDTNFIQVTEESECGLRVVEIAKWEMTKGGCGDDFIKQFTVIWYAEDMAGNISNFEQEITIVRSALDDVEFPADTLVQCLGEGFGDLALYDSPTINGRILTDMCGFRVKAKVLDTLPGWLNGQCLHQVKKEWTIIENCTGIMRIDTQRITMIDTIRPIIGCSALEDTVTLIIDEESCGAIYQFPTASAIDFCAPDEELSFEYLIDGTLSGQEVLLDAGTYRGSVVVHDPCSNTDTCYYTIQVLDATPPLVTCSPDTIFLVENNQELHISDLEMTTEECAGEVELEYRFEGQTPEMNSSLQILTCDMANTTVNILVTATDTSGNISLPQTCELYISADEGLCNLRHSRSPSEISFTLDAASKRTKAYYDGSHLQLKASSGMKEVILYDLSGQIVWSQSWSESKLKYQANLPGNLSGIYMVRFAMEDGQSESVKIAIF